MINCVELNEKLDLYLQSAVSEELKEEIESHLGSCEDCRLKCDFLSRLIDTMREQASSYSAPGHLKERILTEIKRRRAAARRRKFATFAGLGAVALLILTFALPGLLKPNLKASLADFAALYDSYAQGVFKPDLLAKDLEKAEAWLKERQFAITLPRASVAGYDLVGVSLRVVAKRPSAVSLFEDEKSKEKIAYIAFEDKKLNIDFPRRELVSGKYLYVTRENLHSFALWRDGDMINILVSPDAEEELLQYARLCIELIEVGKPSD